MAQKKYNVGVQEVEAGSVYTWGYANGYGGASGIKGDVSDWLFAKGTDESALANGTTLYAGIATSQIAQFLGFQGVSTSGSTWIAVPIAAAGYRTFRVNMTGNLNQDVNVTGWLMPDANGEFNGINISTSGGPLFAQAVVTAEVLNSSAPLQFGPGGKDLTVFYAGPIGWLVLQIAKTTNPTSGNLRVGVERQR